MVNRATHELIIKADGKPTGVKWDCKSGEIRFRHGGWSCYTFTRQGLEEIGFSLKPVYMPMVNK